ncbi:MAG: arginine--tRNA ligase [Bacteroidota bacterium]|nr:arginine--tRNA ligase [Bacteroidota bacterium]
MVVENLLKQKIGEYLLKKYSIPNTPIEIIKTRKEFKGDYTVVLFPILSLTKLKPNQIGEDIGKYLMDNENYIEDFNIIQGFLNLTIADFFLVDLLKRLDENLKFDYKLKSEYHLIEFSSPNTNKPLHLGHVRNILLGDSISRIFNEVGHNIHKTQIINDRGIHICKSMVAWLQFGKDTNPESLSLKGDVFVGNFYVKYNEEYEKQVNEMVSNGISEAEAKKNAPIFKDAKELLIKWESGNKEVIDLWSQMNSWVYEGFLETYKNLKVSFDSEYFESDTYLKGKEIVLKGLKDKVFYKKDDNSVWVDLKSYGLDEKLLLRSDGTSVYITQDIGTAFLRYKDHPKMDGMIYTTGNEQDYHFKVLFKVLSLLSYPWAKKLNHLSYGMVDLPSGKMKSREGLVVDADELIESMNTKAKIISESLGKINDLSVSEQSKLYKQVSLAALKYHILKVDPKKSILFDPNESIDFNGNTGPFIQYTYARIKSLSRKNKKNNINFNRIDLSLKEKDLIIQLNDFPNVILNAYKNINPGLIANFCYELVKLYNSFYQSSTILGNDEINSFRIMLSNKVGNCIKKSMFLLGIEVPERM